MKYRSFGRTDWQVSQIGFGGWQLGCTWGSIDKKESIQTLLYAFDKGINFVDTAFAYGNGHSEKVIGSALEQWSGNRIYVATKVMPLLSSLSNLDPDADMEMRGRYPGWYSREMVEGSLSRLGVERLDLLQLHFWIPRGLTELDWLESLNVLRQEGKVDRIGVSLADIRPQQGVSLARFGLMDSIQVMYNMFEQEPSDVLFPEGLKSRTAFIARVPFDSGALTGNWTRETYGQWDPDDKRHSMYRGKRFMETLDRVDKLKRLCQPHFSNLAEAALKFVLAHPAVSVVIPGMRNKQEVDQNTDTGEGLEFPPELLHSLRAHRWKHEFYH